MKRFLAVVVILILLSLCGCAGITKENHRYLIASIGFDKTEKQFMVTIEAVAVNSEDDDGKKRLIITAQGETPKKAIENAEKKATQPFELSHCGVIATAKGLNDSDFAGICDYCYNTDEITFSAYMLTCESAYELLSRKPVSSVAAGYDLMSIIDKESKQRNRKFRNTLYEVTAEKNREGGKVELPEFILSGEFRLLIGTHSYYF